VLTGPWRWIRTNDLAIIGRVLYWAELAKVILAGAVRVERTPTSFKGSLYHPLSYTPVDCIGALPQYRAALFGSSNRRITINACAAKKCWWFGQASILGPKGYEPAALPAELPNH
jgi:hypothetical protein